MNRIARASTWPFYRRLPRRTKKALLKRLDFIVWRYASPRCLGPRPLGWRLGPLERRRLHRYTQRRH